MKAHEHQRRSRHKAFEHRYLFDVREDIRLKLAIATYEGLLAESPHAAQRLAIEESLKALRNWRM